jgi:hypothetical protein
MQSHHLVRPNEWPVAWHELVLTGGGWFVDVGVEVEVVTAKPVRLDRPDPCSTAKAFRKP